MFSPCRSRSSSSALSFFRKRVTRQTKKPPIRRAQPTIARPSASWRNPSPNSLTVVTLKPSGVACPLRFEVTEVTFVSEVRLASKGPLPHFIADMIEPDAIVFVVDDDPSVRRSTERLLRSAGLRVQTYSS